MCCSLYKNMTMRPVCDWYLVKLTISHPKNIQWGRKIGSLGLWFKISKDGLTLRNQFWCWNRLLPYINSKTVERDWCIFKKKKNSIVLLCESHYSEHLWYWNNILFSDYVQYKYNCMFFQYVLCKLGRLELFPDSYVHRPLCVCLYLDQQA